MARVNGRPMVIPQTQESNSLQVRVQKVGGREHRDTAPNARTPEEARDRGGQCQQVGKILR